MTQGSKNLQVMDLRMGKSIPYDGHDVMLPCWNSLKKSISLAKVPNLWRLQTLRHQDQEFLVKKVAARALAKAPRQALS